MKKALVALVIVLISALSATAGKLTDGLRAAYQSEGGNSWQPVLIALSSRVSASDLLIGMDALPLDQAHTRVMRSLQTNAAATQTPVIKSLEILQSTGMARNIRSLWLCDVISAELTRPAAELMANMAEVDEVGLDEIVTLRRAVDVQPESSSSADGISDVGALEAWVQGYRGENRIICVIGDGAAVSHGALAGNWRGSSAPISECWYDAGGNASPVSCGTEAIQIFGTACGAASGSSPAIGIAPSAQWIAAGIFCQQTRLSDVIRALEWAADPDGNAATMSDVPDAIVCAFDLNAACFGGEPQAMWDAVSNAEGLGPVLLFASGQNGEQVSSPESHALCFSVGYADTRGRPFAAGATSAHGPSACDSRLVKPDLTAPGTAVLTTGDVGYTRVTGSGVAAGYAAGVVALVREVNPNLRAQEIRNILVTTAAEAGAPGPDNSFGSGVLNASAAVTMAKSAGPSGTLRVAVRYGGTSIPGARVVLSGAFGDRTADTDGGDVVFEHLSADARYALSVGRFGYEFYRHADSVSVQAGTSVNVFADLKRGFHDDAEHDQGWSLGVSDDDATSGTWIRVVPVPSRVQGKLVQPDADATPDGWMCFVTGNAASENEEASAADVDGGRTTLRSPRFSLQDVESPVLQFSYWYSNDRGANPGSDFFRVQISGDDGASWKSLVNTSTSTPGWAEVSFPIRDFVTPSDRMILQFIAEDYGPGSLVEAAVDDIRITGAPSAPEPPRGLVLDVQFNQVVLHWQPSEGASGYRVYLSGERGNVIHPENLFTVISDTTLIVPLSDIPFEQFFFQVTAIK